MSKMVLSTVAAVLLALGVLAVPASAASAAPAAPSAPAASTSAERTHDCVTKREFRGAKKGWRMERVHRRFDTKGHLTSQSGAYKSREYKSCTNPRYSYVSVSYRHGKVWYKSAYWG